MLPTGAIKFSDLNKNLFNATSTAQLKMSTCENVAAGVPSTNVLMSSLKGKASYQTYPPWTLTGTSTTLSGLSYGNGTYVATCSSSWSSESAYNGFHFESGGGNDLWVTGSSSYNTTSPYAYTGSYSTTISGTAYLGEWLQIQLPAPVTILQYTMLPQPSLLNRSPLNFVIGGSTNGTTWTLVDTRINITDWTYGNTFNVATPGSYSYYILVVTNNNGGGWTSVSWNLYNYISFNYTGDRTYPPTSLTTYTNSVSGQTYGNGTYIVSASTEYSGTGVEWAYDAFQSQSLWWTTSGTSYNASSPYSYSGAVSTTISGSAYAGEWLQIQLPNPVTVYTYTMYTRSYSLTRGPNTFKLAGSTDGTTWTLVDTQTGISWTASGNTFTCASPGSYSYYRLVVNTNNGGQFLSISNWTLLNYQTLTIPSGFTKMFVEAWGAGGGSPGTGNVACQVMGAGGAGGCVSSTLSVSAGQVFKIIVGGGGQYTSAGGAVLSSYGGGGSANVYSDTNWRSASGGGRSAIQMSNVDILTAGAGGGGGRQQVGTSGSVNGGAGGGTVGANGDQTSNGGGYGGTQAAGGQAGSGNTGVAATAGAQYLGGSGNQYGAGGGSGYFGGGGSGINYNGSTNIFGGAGGGSSYINTNYVISGTISANIQGSSNVVANNANLPSTLRGNIGNGGTMPGASSNANSVGGNGQNGYVSIFLS